MQAIYDAESIAFLVRWHDMGADKTGRTIRRFPCRQKKRSDARSCRSRRRDVGRAPSAIRKSRSPRPRRTPSQNRQRRQLRRHQSSPTQSSIQIPTQTPTSARKPYFIFGDAQNSVDLWFFDLARPEPLQFTGRGSADIAANDTGDLTGVASYDQGEWSVIFKRPLRASAGAPFTPGEFLPIAFSVWDGFSRERGNRRGLTAWYSIYVEPQVVPSAIGPMVRTALLILVIELAVIGWVRWRHAPWRPRGARR